jgi:type I restriction enzyme S subunit
MTKTLSAGWRVKRLGDVAKVIPGYAFKSKDWCKEGIPVIKIKNIVGDLSVDTVEADCVPSDILTDKLRKFVLDDGDILVAMTGATAGKVGRLRCKRPHLLNQRVAKLAPFDVDSLFFWAVVSSDEYQGRFFKLADGAAQPNMSGGQIEGVELLIPSRSTQRKIAGVLSAYDDLIENNTRRIAILEEMAQAIYREWFVNFRFPGHEKVKLINSPLGQIPEGWKLQPLKEVYRTSSGGTPSRKVDEYYDGGSINWVKTKELDDRFIWDTEEKITEAGLANSSAKVFPANTVIMAMYGATIGQLGILGAEATTNQACCGFLTNHSEYGYPYLFLNLLANRTDIINLRAGAAQQNVSQDVIREIPFLVPPLPIVHEFNELVEPFLQGMFRLQKKNINLTRTRDLLLPKLISGQLDVEELDIDTGEPLVEATT